MAFNLYWPTLRNGPHRSDKSAAYTTVRHGMQLDGALGCCIISLLCIIIDSALPLLSPAAGTYRIDSRRLGAGMSTSAPASPISGGRLAIQASWRWGCLLHGLARTEGGSWESQNFWAPTSRQDRWGFPCHGEKEERTNKKAQPSSTV